MLYLIPERLPITEPNTGTSTLPTLEPVITPISLATEVGPKMDM